MRHVFSLACIIVAMLHATAFSQDDYYYEYSTQIQLVPAADYVVLKIDPESYTPYSQMIALVEGLDQSVEPIPLAINSWRKDFKLGTL